MLRVIFVVFSLWLYSLSAQGASFGGIEFDDQVVGEDGSAMVLNGGGIRSKWFIKVYAMALYLPALAQEADIILGLSGPSYIRMHFLFDVSKERLLGTLEEGFAANHTPEQLAAMAAEIEQLRSLFKGVNKGDEVVLDYVPDQGTRIAFNGEYQGVIPGLSFHQAILRVWLGDKPADKKLKQALLSGPQ